MLEKFIKKDRNEILENVLVKIVNTQMRWVNL